MNPGFSNDERNFKELSVREGDGIKLPCYDRPTFTPPGHFSWYYKFDNIQDQIPARSIDRFDIDSNGERDRAILGGWRSVGWVERMGVGGGGRRTA